MAVLDGGFPKWQAEDRPVEDMPPMVRDRHLTVRFQNRLVRDVTQVSHASKLGTTQIVDARAAARFRGDAPEPREGLPTCGVTEQPAFARPRRRPGGGLSCGSAACPKS